MALDSLGRAWLMVLPLAAVSWAPSALAAIPAGYTGTPYKGTPQVIPGRVELADLDEGGLNVAFFADHRRENAVAEGYSPVSGDDYRPGNLALPNICKTNRALEKPGEGSEDTWEDGTRYPSETNLYSYYMGFAHTVDWVRVTVNVQQAGKYKVSSNWACANPRCGLSIWFNDGNSPADNPQRPMDGQNKSGIIEFEGTNDYHKWRAYPNFAEVELSAGVQLMTFNLEVADHLQYGFLQFDLVGGGGTGGGGAAGAGAGGNAGAGTGGSGGATGGTPGAAGSGSGGQLGQAGATASTGGSNNPGTGGTPTLPAGGSGGSAPQGSGGSAGTTPAPSAPAEDSGCALAPTQAPTSPLALAALLALSLLGSRRRAKRG